MGTARTACLVSLCAAVMTATMAAEPAQPRGRGPAVPACTTIACDVQGDWERTKTLVLGLVNAMPDDKFGYKPTPAQQSIGFIAQHLANDNYFFCNNFGTMKGTRAAADTTTADSVKATWPKETLVSQLKASIAFCEQALGQLDDTKLADQVTMTFRGQSRQAPRAQMVLGHALDMADHYSQIANYMRLNNLIPPTALPRPTGR